MENSQAAEFIKKKDVVFPDNSSMLDAVKKPTPKQWTCKRCDSTWEARIKTKPIQCPRCKSPFWDSPRKREAAYA